MRCQSIQSMPERTEITNALAVDFDGVITDHASVKSAKFQKRGFDLDPGETDRKFCISHRDVPESVYDEVSREANLSLDETPLRAGVKSGLRSLHNAGYTPVIVTSRYDDEAAQMVEYVRNRGVPVNWYINTSREPKTSALETISALALIDDSYYKIKSVLESGKTVDWELLFFQHEANSYRDDIHPEIRLLRGWEEIVEYYC